MIVFCQPSFVQEDDSVPASLGQQSEADSEDVLDALIQHELTKFQQQQADKYAALLSEGQVVLPLPSPAPEQQQLRAQQKQQEALKGKVLTPAYVYLDWLQGSSISLAYIPKRRRDSSISCVCPWVCLQAYGKCSTTAAAALYYNSTIPLLLLPLCCHYRHRRCFV